MTPFLQNIANKYWQKYNTNISNITFVFPNRRSGIFFLHYLIQIADQPFFAPSITTISDLIASMSSYQQADRISLMFTLYKSYINVSNSDEPFDQFHYWGEMLLNDFDDVDKYLVDVKQLFKNIYDLKEIEDNYSYLNENQIAIIKRFWASFLPVENDEKKKSFYEIWEILLELYYSFKKHLALSGLAYEGMMFREVVDNLEREDIFSKIPSSLVFIGLNAHTKSEEKFLSFVNKLNRADFYWDYNSPLVRDKDNKSSHFVDYNRFMFRSKIELDEDFSFENTPKLSVIGVSSAIGQTKYIHNILTELKDQAELSERNLLKTAIVLPDENLLLPTLYSIPNFIDKINVTMGYNLTNSPIVSLMNNIYDLHLNFKKSNQNSFYFRNVLTILNHKYILELANNESKILQETIVKFNKVRLLKKELIGHKLFDLIFTPVYNWLEFSLYLKNILRFIQTNSYQKKNSSLDEENKNADNSFDIESEFIIEYYKSVSTLEESVSSSELDVDIDTYIKYIKKTIVGVSVPFKGEPLAGLQIMGVLETRTLDFDNLIIMSMNEGIFPSKKIPNSFIPHSLRKGFDLPTYEHQDAIYAYHFYRLISRAKNIYLLYDSRTNSSLSGEVSRYYNQIKHIYSNFFDISENLLVYEVATTSLQTITIDKNYVVQEKLNNFLEGGNRKLSASALNTYLDCPLQFYFSVVEGLGEIEEVEETIEASMFGTIFHYMMENIYNRYTEKIVTSDTLLALINDDKYLDKLLIESFAVNFYKKDILNELRGQNYLVGEIIKKYVKKVLTEDSKLLKFKYIKSEEKIQLIYEINEKLRVNLIGFIDRIDQIGDKRRIIDYKTGKGTLSFNNIENLFDKDLPKRPKAIMQVFMYAHLYMIEHPDCTIEPNIYYLRHLYWDKFETAISHRQNREKNYIHNFDSYRSDFKDKFEACISEIFDPAIPFSQTTTEEACKWCPFTNICRK